MNFAALLNYFLENEGTWAILFCFMFLYFLKTTRDRERERAKELREFRKKLEEEITIISANTTFIMTTWKLVLEKEMSRRRKKE
jgi:Na+/melibiose symporter-like transporter